MEKYPKSNINRIKEYEFEEIILNDIENLNKYISAINFSDLDNFYKCRNNLENYIFKFQLDIDILIDNKKINIHNV